MNSVISEFKTNKLLATAFLFSFLAFSISLMFEYGFGEKPCKLCLWQRWPLLFACVLSLLAIFTKWQTQAVWLLVGVFTLEFGLATYHLMVQNGLVSDPCVVPVIKSADQFWSSLNAPLPCAKVSWEILGIPAAAFNAAASLWFGMSLAEFAYKSNIAKNVKSQL